MMAFHEGLQHGFTIAVPSYWWAHREEPMLRVRDIMTRDVISVGPELSLRDAVDLLAQKRISGAPVLAGRRPIGVLSAGDILAFEASQPVVPAEQPDFLEQGEFESQEEQLAEVDGADPPAAYFTEFWDDAGADTAERFQDTRGPEWDLLGEHTVAEAMSRGLRTIRADAAVAEAARRIRDEKIHRLLVMEGETLVGIITTFDIVAAVADRRL
jgi:CBS domain-containing protein